MAIFKSQAELLTDGGQRVGAGMLYLHLPRGTEHAQRGTGTLSLRNWEPTVDPPTALELEDGRRLAISVTRDALSECSRNRVLRFAASWPPEG